MGGEGGEEGPDSETARRTAGVDSEWVRLGMSGSGAEETFPKREKGGALRAQGASCEGSAICISPAIRKKNQLERQKEGLGVFQNSRLQVESRFH